MIEVMLDPFEVLGPKAASKRLPDGTMVSEPLENMAPFLDRNEFLSNMVIPTVDQYNIER
jgi:acetolactate synthase-1/2/3 large subunit